MRKHWLWLAIICLAGLGLRFLPFNSVFGGSFISFIESDSYNRLLYAQQISTMPFGDGVTFAFTNNLLFSWLIAMGGKVLPLEVVGALLPPLLGVGTIALVYLLTARLFNPTVGLLAATFTAVIPSEFLHRTLLGFADHHALEVFLLTLAIYLIVRAWQSEHRHYYWIAGSSLTLVAYVINWKSGLLVYAMLVAMAVVLFVVRQRRQAVAVALPVCIAVAIYLPLGGWDYVLGFIPGAQPTVQAGQEVAQTLTSKFTGRTISELRPLLWPYGTFSAGALLYNLHLFTVTFLLGGYFIARKSDLSSSHKVFLLGWALFMLVSTMLYRRNLYYFTINVAIFSGYAVYHIAGWLKGKQAIQAAILAIPLVLISMPLIASLTIRPNYMMTEEWRAALEWMKTQQVSGHVTAWSDYGHWIEYVTGHKPNLLPGPGGHDVATLYLSTEAEEARELMEKLDTDYLIVDWLVMARKNGALVTIAERYPQAYESTLIHRLWHRSDPQPNLTLVYFSQGIKIFKYDGGA